MGWLFAQLVVFSALLWVMTRKTMAQVPVSENATIEPQESTS